MTTQFGIYFGNTTIALAFYKDGKTEVISNDSGDRLTPAVVAYNQNEFITGMAAKASLTHNATGTVINNKRLLNDQLTDEELEQTAVGMPCTVTVNNGSVTYTFNSSNKSATPDDIATHLFKKMYSIAFNIVQSNNIKVVVSVPLYFSQSVRQRVWDCLENAGFSVLQLISEPSAAALAYRLDESDNSKVLVYRVGGVSCDATILQIHNGLYEILATVHYPNLGGNYFTKLLTEYIAKEFFNRWKLDPHESKKSMYKLTRHSELAKHILSTKTSTSLFIESLCDGIDWEQNITRPRFENLISPHMQKYIEPIKECLAKANLTSVTKIIFCGGSTRIPKLQSVIRGSLSADIEVLDDKPDEIIAEGCARQASLLESPYDHDDLSLDVPLLANDVYVCDSNSKVVKVHIPSRTPLPTKITFTESDSKAFEYSIFEGSIENDEHILDKISFANVGCEQSAADFQVVVTQDKITMNLIETC